MNITRSCIYFGQEEVETKKKEKEVAYLHCFSCKKSYTLKEALKFLQLSAPEKVYYRYTKLIEEDKL